LFRLFFNRLSLLNYIKTTLTRFNFKLELNKELGQKVFFLLFFCILSSKIFYQLIRLSLDRPSRLGHNKKTPTKFSFKLTLGKKLGHKVFYVNFIFFSISSSNFYYQLVRLPLYQQSWLGNIRATLILFNFKPKLCKKLSR